jgi:hypothetical protein
MQRRDAPGLRHALVLGASLLKQSAQGGGQGEDCLDEGIRNRAGERIADVSNAEISGADVAF